MRIHIRLAKESDAGQILTIYAPIALNTAISFELAPPGIEEMEQRIKDVLGSHVWLVCEDGPRLLGYAYASKFRPREAYQWAAEVTVYVAAAEQRRGMGKALYRSLLEVLRLQGFRMAVGVIALPNDASVSLHQALGFQQAAFFERVGYKLGRWHDVGWWQLALGDASANPPPPRPISEFIGTARLGEALAAGLIKSV